MAAKHKPQGAGKVINIKRDSVARVEPEPGWKPRGRYGVMRTPEGVPLVALDDLVHWLADRDGLTMQQAVSRVLDALQPADLERMYFTQYENLAADIGGVPEWAMWDAMAGVDRELAAPVVGTGDGFEQFLDSAPMEPAQRLHLLRERARAAIWAVLLQVKPESEVIAAAHISILATRAHELYGWGCVVAVDAAPARVLVKDQNPEWTGKRIHERIGELEKQNHSTPVAAVVAEVGLSDREVRRRRTDYLKASASPIVSMAAGLQGRRKAGT